MLVSGYSGDVPRITFHDNGYLRGKIIPSDGVIVHYMDSTHEFVAKDRMTRQIFRYTTKTAEGLELARKEIDEYEKTTMQQMSLHMATQGYPALGYAQQQHVFPSPAYGTIPAPLPSFPVVPPPQAPVAPPQLALPAPPPPATYAGALVPYNQNQSSSLADFTIRALVVVTAIVVISCSLAVAYKIACQPQQPFLQFPPPPSQEPITMDKFFYFMNTWESTKPKKEEQLALPGNMPPPPPPSNGHTDPKQVLVDAVPVDSIFGSWIWQAIAFGIITVLYYLFVIPCWNAFTNSETPAARRKRYSDEARRAQQTTPPYGSY